MLCYKGYYFFLMAVLFPAILLAQEKREIEKRISETSIDVSAKNCAHILSAQKQLKRKKWYLQIKEQDSVYELKFKYLKQNYSLEFNMDGSPENVEVEFAKKALEPSILAKFKSALSSRFEQYKIRKIQKGFEELESINCEQLIIIDQLEKLALVYYEIVILGSTPEDKSLYEVTFDASGSIVHLQKIILQSTDVLDY